MAVEDAVELLAVYVEDEGETLRERHGPEAVAAAKDMAALISQRFQAVSAHVSLWSDFQRAPRAHVEELAGALEAHIEGDPSLARVLSAFMRELRGEMATPKPAEPPAEQRIAGEGGDALDNAVSLEGDEVEQDRRSYQPEAMGSSVDYDASVDRGTYIYGEMAAGKDTIGQEAGVETFDIDDSQTRPTELAALTGVSGLFEELRVAVEDHPVLDRSQKHEIDVQLRALEEAVQEPEAGDDDQLTRHLSQLQQMAPDVAEIVIETLTALELPISTQQAVEQLRLQPPEEGHMTE